MQIKITNKDTGSKVLVDDSLTLDDIRAHCPGFFSESNNQFFGDETYHVHRGQLIVEGTRETSDHHKHRTINVYLCVLDYLTGSDKGRGFDTLHLGWPRCLEDAKRLIDYCLETKQRYYGMKVHEDWEPKDE
jgi:hypothetical protein